MRSGEAPQVDHDGLADGQIFSDPVGLDDAIECLLGIGCEQLDIAAVSNGVGVGMVSPNIDGGAGSAVTNEDGKKNRTAAGVLQNLDHVEKPFGGGGCAGTH